MTNYEIVPIPAEYRDQYGSMSAMGAVKRVMLHCTATYESSDDLGFEWLWDVHVRQNGWSGPGYHYAVEHDGTILETRPTEYQGAGCSGQNANTVHIAYFGGLEDGTGRSKDTRTQAQEEATVWLLKWLTDEHPEFGASKDISGHNQWAAKDCPCFYVPDWVEEVVNRSEQGGEEPEPNMPDLVNMVQYIKDLETRIQKLESHNNAWGSP